MRDGRKPIMFRRKAVLLKAGHGRTNKPVEGPVKEAVYSSRVLPNS